MIPLSRIRDRFGNYNYMGVLLSIAACAIVVGTHARTATQRTDESVTTELGLESAWPHVRVDFVPSR
ncbi:MAG: hypothetical protein LZF60_80056 [Nitrospira sp.]|nr:MAG: hypothetical protein LZF60_80056 [Nitrospira sp.]